MQVIPLSPENPESLCNLNLNKLESIGMNESDCAVPVLLHRKIK